MASTQEGQKMTSEQEKDLVQKVCANIASAATRKAEDALRILGDPRKAVHLPVSDDTSAYMEFLKR